MNKQYVVGGQTIVLVEDETMVAVRFKEPAMHSTRLSVSAKAGLGPFSQRFEVPKEKYTLLRVGQAAPAAGAAGSFRTETVNRLQASSEISRVAPVFKMGGRRIVATDRVLVGLTDPAADPLATLNQKGSEVVSGQGGEYVVRLPESADPFVVAAELMTRHGVAYAEPDLVTIGRHLSRSGASKPLSPPAGDPLLDRQYAPHITRAVDAWAVQPGDPAVKVAILDEGVDSRHEDLRDRLAGFYDAADDDEFQEPNSWDGHGTACAGLAGAVPHNGTGIRGIGNGISLLAVRIAYSSGPNQGWTTSNSWIARAIDWAWSNGADVLSNSWGGGAPSQAIINAFARARSLGRSGKGAVLVVAAGNDAGPVTFPGTVPHMLTVSASNEFDEFKTRTSHDGEHWWGSNFGPAISLSAPGVHNLTTDISGGSGYAPGHYTDFNGTSSATPIVAGAAGLVLSANPALTEAEVRALLMASADKVGSAPYHNGRNDQFGHGRLNVHQAVLAARNKVQP